MLKLSPTVREAVASEDGLKTGRLEGTGLDELQQPDLVLGATDLKRDGAKVLGGENAHRRAVNVAVNGFDESFLDQRIPGCEKLHRPASDDYVFVFDGATPSGQIIIDRLQADERPPRLGLEGDKDIHIEGGDRLEVEVAPTAPPMA